MRLTQWTDYTLRVLMYCAATEGRVQPVTITEIASGYGISRSHLMKIVQELSAQGLLDTTRGRGGGIRLMRPASTINIGAVVRATETDFHLVECFDATNDQCRLSAHCGLKGVLWRAMQAFLGVLDTVTLADLMAPSNASTLALLPPTSGSATAIESAARALQPAVALPRSGAAPRRRAPMAGLPSQAQENE